MRYILLGEFIQKTNWFVFEILFFYILFWFLYKFFSVKTADILLCMATILLIIFGFYFQIANPWYGSSLCFPLGILYAQQERKWDAVLLKHYFMKNFVLIIGCGICIILFFILGNDSVVGNPIARNLAAVFFCLWVLSVLQKVSIEYRVLQWLGKISYEIFLLHPFWINIVENYVTKPWSYIFLVITLTIMSSALLQSIHAICCSFVSKMSQSSRLRKFGWYANNKRSRKKGCSDCAMIDRCVLSVILKEEKYETASAEHCHQVKDECSPYQAKA